MHQRKLQNQRGIDQKISEVAESYLGEPIKDAVITVPHSF